MSSNVQTQINDLNAAVQALDSSLTQITGNTMSNYNQLSRIVSQQANIYNTVYYGTGNMSTGNLVVSANCNISGNLIMNNGNLNITRGNVIMSNGNLGIGTSNPIVPLHVVGSTNLLGTLLNASNMDLSTATFSNQNQGYIRFGNIMVQWGSIGDTTTQKATFSPSFSEIPYAAFVQRQSVTGSGSTAAGASVVTGLTTANITVDSVYGSTDKSSVYWLVIGQIG